MVSGFVGSAMAFVVAGAGVFTVGWWLDMALRHEHVVAADVKLVLHGTKVVAFGFKEYLRIFG